MSNGERACSDHLASDSAVYILTNRIFTKQTRLVLRLHISAGGLFIRGLSFRVLENRCLFDKWNEGQAAHERPQRLRYNDAFRRLIVFNDAADCSLGGGQRAVEHVHVHDQSVTISQQQRCTQRLLLATALCLRTALNLASRSESRLKAARLIVQAIAARHELSVRFGSREPRFEIVPVSRQ